MTAEYEAWVVAVRPFIEKAVSSAARHSGNPEFFLSRGEAQAEADNLNRRENAFYRVWRIVVRFEKA